MPGPEVTPGPRGQGPVWRLARPAVALAGGVVFQVLLASVFAGGAHHPVPHQAPVAGRSPPAPGGTAPRRGGGAAAAARAASRAPQRAAHAADAAVSLAA